MVGPGMVPSNPFRIQPGKGVASVRVSPGTSWVKSTGVTLLLGGVPLCLGGLALYGYGLQSERDGVRVAGTVTLALGAAAVLGSLPLLGLGSTSVYDGEGTRVAAAIPR